MLEEHERQSNHRPKEESMDMTDIHMVEVESMDMVAEHPSKEQPGGGWYRYGGGGYGYGGGAPIEGAT
jgi:hypothetical protein